MLRWYSVKCRSIFDVKMSGTIAKGIIIQKNGVIRLQSIKLKTKES